MINPELEKYVQTSLANSLDAPTIRRVLLAAGWDPQEVDAAIAAAQNPTAAVPVPIVIPPINPTTVPGAVGPATAPKTAAPAAAPATMSTVATPATTTSLAPTGGSSKKKLIVAGAIVLLVLIAGGGAFAAYQNGWIPGLGGSTADAALLAKLPDNLQAISSATYNATLDLNSKPREAGAIPFAPSQYYDSPSSSIASYLRDLEASYMSSPADISFHLAVGGSTAKSDASSTDGTFHLGADVALSDFNLSVDADFLTKGKNLYGRINKFPSLFIDLSALKGKWVAITANDASGLSGGFIDGASIQGFVSSAQDNNKQWLEQTRLIYQLSEQQGVIVMSAPGTSEQLGGVNTRHLHLALVKDKVSAFYAAATQELKDKYGDDAIWKFDQTVADYLASPGFDKLFDYLKANVSFDVWLDAKSGQLAQLAYSLRIVPPDTIEKLKNIEYVLQLTLALSDVNQPVAIEAPANAISLDEAEILISGKSRDEVYAERQIQNINILQNALALYYVSFGKYPDTLSALTVASNTSTYMELRTMPVDAYTQAPYNYRKSGKDFVIEYTITVPKGSTSLVLPQVVNGTNTATSKTLSTQKKP